MPVRKVDTEHLAGLMEDTGIGTGQLAQMVNELPDTIQGIFHRGQGEEFVVKKMEAVLGAAIRQEQLDPDSQDRQFSIGMTGFLIENRTGAEILSYIEEGLLQPSVALKFELKRREPRKAVIDGVERMLTHGNRRTDT